MWIFPAVLSSFANALLASVNQRYQIKGEVLIIWRGLIPALLLAPFLLFFSAPADPVFYLFVGLNACIVRFTDAWFFETVRRYGASLPLKLNPLIVIFVFMAWLIIDPGQREAMAQHPWVAIGVGGSLLASLLMLALMTRCHVTAEAFRFYLPRMAGGVLIDIFNKQAMLAAYGWSGPIYYAALISAAIFFLSLPHMRIYVRQGRLREEMRRSWVAGCMIGILSVAGMLTKNLAMFSVPNPAYVTTIIMASSLWVIVYARLRRRPDPGPILPSLGFLASAIILIILVKML